jgi:hypothetical protein
MSGTIPTQAPADLLDQAASMLAFLMDVAPGMSTACGHTSGLNDASAYGLTLIIDHIKTTVDQARSLI